MRLRVLAMAGLMAGLAGVASAQTFLISQNGKAVGSATMTWTRSGPEYGISSTASINMTGLNLSFSETGNLGAHLNLNTMQLNGQVNGTPVTVGTQRTNQQFLMKIFANGQRINTPLAYHSRTVFLPDFDPAGLEAMLRLGAAYDNARIWAVIPKQTGSVMPVEIATDADMQGTLDGKTITVHHFTVNVNDGVIEVFSSMTSDLLQAEWTHEGFALVRQGFVLTPPKHPIGAPPPPPPASQQTGPPNAPTPQTQPPTQAPTQPQ